jgi:hypothetical protein
LPFLNSQPKTEDGDYDIDDCIESALLLFAIVIKTSIENKMETIKMGGTDPRLYEPYGAERWRHELRHEPGLPSLWIDFETLFVRAMAPRPRDWSHSSIPLKGIKKNYWQRQRK